MKILVTGGAGFIGSHLVQRLLRLGHDVAVLDDLSGGAEENLAACAGDARLDLRIGSVTDRATVRQAAAGCELIFHLAARVGVRHYVEHPLDVLQTNLHGTESVLEAARDQGARVVFASTSEVYGKNAAVPFREEADRVLGSASVDRWCYATSKAADEHLCFAYHRLGVPVTVVRYFNAYGPGAQTGAYGGVAMRFVRQALAGVPITVYGDGGQSRTFTHVDDIVAGTVLAGLDGGAAGEAFNLGSEDEISISALAERIRQLCGGGSPIVHIPYREAMGEGYEDVRRRVPSIEKASRRLGYRPTITLAEGLARTIRWCRGHPER